MSPTEIYLWLRQAGFSHSEAYNYVNRGVIPHLTTEMKRTAIQRLQSKSTKGTKEKS